MSGAFHDRLDMPGLGVLSSPGSAVLNVMPAHPAVPMQTHRRALAGGMNA